MSTKPDTLVEDRGVRIRDEILRIIYTVWNAAQYRRADVVNQFVCQRDMISMKPDTPVEDRGPQNSRRHSKNYLHRLECDAISTSWRHKSVYVGHRDIISTKPGTLDGDRRPSNLRRSYNNCLPRFNFDATSTSGYATQKCKVNCPLLEYSGYVWEYSRRVGVLYNAGYRWRLQNHCDKEG